MTPPPSATRLTVRHETGYDYDAPVEVAHHSAWLEPRDTAWQRVCDFRLDIDPEPDAPVQRSRDAFGNWRLGFGHARVHDRLSVVSSFEVELRAPPPLDPCASPAWEEVVDVLRYRAGQHQPRAVEFVLATHYAPRDARLLRLAADLFSPRRPLLDAALTLMSRIHERMKFRPQSTDVATRATDALELGEGVCQDFAHLMIGSLRSLGLAASYVSGYLLTIPPPGQARLVGADASHAWVALWCPVNGWVALDPTNDTRVGTDHVTLAWGRDYADVAPLRGVIRGGGATPPTVAVTVQPVEAP